MPQTGLLTRVIQSLCCLPGVGSKSAQRMAFHLLQKDRQGARQLADTLLSAIDNIDYCQFCRTLTEQTICEICSNPARERSVLCVVETPADAWVIEQAAVFNGLFFILHGRLSPLDGIGPDELGMSLMEQHFSQGEVKELILATNSTVEGEATAYFIAEIARKFNIKVCRIAQGVPMGGELEFIDGRTLSYAFKGRTEI